MKTACGSLTVTAAGRVLTFDGTTEVLVGRDPASTIQLTDERVSRHHATIRPTGTGWLWEDHSTRGTWHDGHPVDTFPLELTMSVRLGDPGDGPEVILAATPPPTIPALAVTGPGGHWRLRAGDESTVGRDPDCGIVVDHPTVSRRHLVVAYEPATGWVVSDQGSSGGTFLDGARVERVVVDRVVELRLAHPVKGLLFTFEPANAPDHGTAESDRLGGVLHTSLRGPSFVLSRPVTERIRIGRAPDNDVVVADDLTVSRYHAELCRVDGTVELVDLKSRTGTFLDGARVTSAKVTGGAVIGVGRHFFVFRDGQLEEYLDDAATLVAEDISVTVAGGRRLLDGVTFAVEPGQMVAVVGPAGAGKSTLLKALTGFAPATAGSVTYNGRDLYRSLDELRYRMGYVPQDDILHTQLPLGQALRFSAELRFADDTLPIERAARVDEVLNELGIANRADLAVSKLSGGQRKRTSVAVELLTRPALLFLDEPTTGLDPGNERSVMKLLRDLADGGRTVVVITHSVASLELCDRVLFIAPGGRMAYYGHPTEVLDYFGAGDYAEVFQRLENEDADWCAAFRGHPAWERYVATPLRRAPRPGGAGPGSANPPRRAGGARQLVTLMRRNIAVLLASRASATMLVAQAPLIAVLILISMGSGNLEDSRGGEAGLAHLQKSGRALLLVLVVAAVAMGLVNASREIVKELAIYRRERTVGLSLPAYLGSKFACLGVLALAQAVVLTVLVVLFQGGPPALPFTLGFVIFLLLLSAVALGLAISALVATDSAALVLIPVVIVGQLILANAVFEVDGKAGLGQVAWVTPSYWGFAAAASSADLYATDKTCLVQQLSGEEGRAARSVLGELPCSGLWERDVAHYVAALLPLIVLSLALAAVTGAALRRRDPLAARRRPALIR